MSYDSDVTSSVLDIDLKRRTWRVDFQRPQVTGAGSLYANCFVKEDAINTTSGSATSGSVVASTSWLITIDRDQVFDRNNAGSFFNDLIGFIDGLKTEYDASGSLATGSITQII